MGMGLTLTSCGVSAEKFYQAWEKNNLETMPAYTSVKVTTHEKVGDDDGEPTSEIVPFDIYYYHLSEEEASNYKPYSGTFNEGGGTTKTSLTLYVNGINLKIVSKIIRKNDGHKMEQYGESTWGKYNLRTKVISKFYSKIGVNVMDSAIVVTYEYII